MKLCGLQKTTLLDFPGHVAATIFTGGCNFRCPFCHNSDLLDIDAPASLSEDEVLSFLSRRTGILEGVAITGGEPTLQPDLDDFIKRIREFGYQIKLDTNGCRPDVLKKLCSDGLIDYVAMDIKTCKERYPAVAGIPFFDMKHIEESIDFLKSGVVPYEFRTTVVRELHSADDFEKIGPWIEGGSNYFLQNFVASERVLHPGFSGYTKDELRQFAEIMVPFVGHVALRGVD
ncbi:MAG: anaerobic ribonucleoside-triphosphate reductase activating protein [Lachnospiraceae bacterium]|nr:anaerobic ribonucleoside-triphosphate reductase activating protein [Lachnospiraceae bacterium]NBJ81694.1 anaerobic ribonucleoside-triphosphate reductase activating protein [bacterium 1XD42-76]NBK05138.1 anaerobic ribonucleoside-triphosphate reductase activating protein [bacterium 1XD42-94]